jgi:hypothetical protein
MTVPLFPDEMRNSSFSDSLSPDLATPAGVVERLELNGNKSRPDAIRDQNGMMPIGDVLLKCRHKCSYEAIRGAPEFGNVTSDAERQQQRSEAFRFFGKVASQSVESIAGFGPTMMPKRNTTRQDPKVLPR